MLASVRCLVVILALSAAPATLAQRPPPAAASFSANKVSGHVYMLTCEPDCGANVTAFVGGDAVVLVDAQEAPYHQLFLAALKGLSTKPVRYVIDTHCHGDHTGGNADFTREGATVIAHRLVRERLATLSTCGPPPGTGLPTVTFDRELTLHLDDEEIRIVKLPAGHTDGDTLVYFRRAKVVATGDAFTSGQLPGADPSNHGNLLGVITALHVIVDTMPEDARVVPGHGPEATMADVRQSLLILEGMRVAIEREVQAGKRLDEIIKMDVLRAWKGRFGEPCVPKAPCDHLDAAYYVRQFYTALSGPQPSP